MQKKTIAQSGANLTLDQATLGWEPRIYAYTQIQVTGMVASNVTVDGVPIASSVATDIVGAAVTNDQLVVITPGSGRYDSWELTFADAAGAASVLVTAYQAGPI